MEAQYVTAPNGNVHLARAWPSTSFRALCGASIAAEWQWGDETQAGNAASCEPCKAHIAQARSHPSAKPKDD